MKQIINIIGLIVVMIYTSIIVNAQHKGETSNKQLSLDNVDCAGCEIEKFQITKSDAGAGHKKRINKVVTGKEFDYQAKNIESPDIEWKLGAAPTWAISPTNPTTWHLNTSKKRSKGKGIVDNTIMPTSNSDFGTTHGHVKLIDANTSDILCEEFDIQVFFSKDEMNANDPSVPNWFYYWSQLLAYNSSPLPIYNNSMPSNPTFETVPINFVYRNDPPFNWNPAGSMNYGKTEFWPQMIPIDFSDPSGPRYAVSYDINMNLGEGCSKICGHDLLVTIDPLGNIISITATSGTGDTGIDCFNQVFYHEYEHIVIYTENWSKGYTTGLGWDTDGDLYSDQFEMDHSMYGFMIGVDDSYDLGTGSAGWDYEENRCRNVEDNLPISLFISDKDWSFDKDNEYQGKNWK